MGTAVAVRAPGAHPLTLAVTSGGTWLPWDSTGTVTHLESTTGRADAAITVPGAAGHRLVVLADGPDLLIADETSGLLHLIEPQRLAPARSAALPAGSVVTARHGALYAAAAPTGQVRRLDRRRLAPIGPMIDLGGALGAIAQSGDGTLWAPVRRSGMVVAIRAGSPSAPVRVAPPGHHIDMALAAGQPVVVDATAGTLTPLTGGRSRVITLPRPAEAAERPLIAAPEVPGRLLPVVDPGAGRLLLADLSSGAVRTVALPAGAGWEAVPTARTDSDEPAAGGRSGQTGLPDVDRPAQLSGTPSAAASSTPMSAARAGNPVPGSAPASDIEPPLWHNGQLYIPGPRSGTALVFDTRSLRYSAPITVPVLLPPVSPGAVSAASAATVGAATASAATMPGGVGGGPTVTANGAQVWVNDPSGPNLVLIDGGRRTILSKQPAGLAGQSGSAPPRPLPPPPPRPSPTPPGPRPATPPDPSYQQPPTPVASTTPAQPDQPVTPPPSTATPPPSPLPQPTATTGPPTPTTRPEPPLGGLPGPGITSGAQSPGQR